MAEHIVELHKEVTENLLKAAATYKANADYHRQQQQFKEGDLVMVFLKNPVFQQAPTINFIIKRSGPLKSCKNMGTMPIRSIFQQT